MRPHFALIVRQKAVTSDEVTNDPFPVISWCGMCRYSSTHPPQGPLPRYSTSTGRHGAVKRVKRGINKCNVSKPMLTPCISTVYMYIGLAISVMHVLSPSRLKWSFRERPRSDTHAGLPGRRHVTSCAIPTTPCHTRFGRLGSQSAVSSPERWFNICCFDIGHQQWAADAAETMGELARKGTEPVESTCVER